MKHLDKEQLLLYTDDLTQIYNRRYLDVLKKGLIVDLSRQRASYTVAIIDIDHFKSINDTFGHLKGDTVIKEFAGFLKSSLRGTDIVVRYGGDEFVCIQPNLRKEDAVFIWERLLKRLKSVKIAGLNITMSIGLASYPEDATDFSGLFSGADAALYEAKRRGRGRVAVLGAKSLSLPITTFINREKELDTIERIIHEKSARVRVVSIVGPVGIGKTRLVKEVLVRTRGREVIWSDCLPFVDNIPYYAIRDIIKYRLRRLGKERFTTFEKPYLIELAKLVPEITDEDIVPLRDERTDKYRLYESIKLFLDTGEKDKIVIIDNLQWADSGTLEVLKYLVLSMKDRNMVYIFIRRSEEKNDEVEEFLRNLSRVAVFSEIVPEPFSRELVIVALKHILSTDTVPSEFADYVYEETGGNPFYIEELLRELYEQEYIEVLGNRWRFKVPEDRIIPKSIEDITERKYRRLSKEEKRIVDLSSIIGYFDADILVELTGFNEGHILGLIDEVISIGIARESFERVEFKEGIARKTIYSHIGRAKRKVYHRHIAEVLMKKHESEKRERLIEIATHLYHARDKRAPYYLLTAAKKAREQYSYKIALNLLEKALELVYISDDREKNIELNIYQEMIDVNHSMGINPRALEIAEKAISSLSLDDGLKLASFYQRKAMVLYSLARYDESIDFAVRALEIYEEHGDKEGMSSTLNVVGIAYLFKGEYGLAEQYLKRAEELFKETGNLGGLASVYNNLGAVYDRLGRLQESLSAYLKSLEIARKFKDLKGETLLLHNIGSVYLDLGEYENALSYLNASLDLAEKISDHLSMSNCYLLLGLLYKEMGKFEKSLDNYKKCVSLADETGDKNLLAWAYENTGEIYYLRGEFEEARKYFEKAGNIASIIKNRYLMFYNILDLSRLLLETGMYKKLDENLKVLEEMATMMGSSRLMDDYKLLKVNYFIKKNDIGGALKLMEDLEEKDSPLYQVLLGEILIAQGKYKDVLHKIKLMEERSFSEFYKVWQMRLKGRTLILMGKKHEAREVLNAALKSCGKMGSKRCEEEVLRLLEDTV